MGAEIRPFRIAVDDEVLADLANRLAGTRWPDAELVDGWGQGVPLATLRAITDYWATEYDWRHRERLLNRFDQFVTTIDGVEIHFVHQRSPHPEAIPLLITHGWPGSIVEFQKVIEPLVDPVRFGGDAADAFHVIAPSLPGFAFSGKPTEAGWGVERIGSTWIELIGRLGYDRYVAQGGDWGASVTSQVGAQDPQHCASIHLTLAMGARPSGDPADPAEQRAIERLAHYASADSGYSLMQKTRPQTIGYSLSDSPVGQLAWILDKFWSWTDCGGDPERVLTRDELLDNVMLYWVTGSATSSARLYWESFGRRDHPVITVPTGFAVYPAEIVPPVRRWVEQMYPDVIYWSEHDRGGHFAAFEVPEIFVADLRAWARRVR